MTRMISQSMMMIVQTEDVGEVGTDGHTRVRMSQTEVETRYQAKRRTLPHPLPVKKSNSKKHSYDSQLPHHLQISPEHQNLHQLKLLLPHQLPK
jgi:hypothetical protein